MPKSKRIKQLQIFLSHANEDKQTVRGLCQRLRDDGFNPWLDEERLLPGQDWQLEIEQALKKSDAILLSFSKRSLSKEGYIQREHKKALDYQKEKPEGTIFVIPVRLDDSEIPFFLRELQCVDYPLGYERLVMALNVRAGKSASTANSPPIFEEQLSETKFIPFQPQPPEPTPRLANMGFQYHPFAWREAERMNLEVLEETYTLHPKFIETIMDLERSAALLAPFGGGKTAARLRLTASLMKKQEEILREIKENKNVSDIPLVVQYINFESIFSQLPAISLENHMPLLLASIAESLYIFIYSYRDLFMRLDNRERDFWWAFLEAYRLGIPLNSDLRDGILLKDWQRISPRSNPIIHGTNLSQILDVLVNHVNRLSVANIFILVDGIDAQTQEQMKMESIPLSLLNHLGLFSIPGIIWKFFLPHQLKGMVGQSLSYLTGRLSILPIQWDQDSLKKFLSERLLWASAGGIRDIAQHCEQELILKLSDVDAELAKIALQHNRLGPPRAMLELADKLYHFGDQSQINLSDWEYFQRYIRNEIQ